MYGVTCNFGCSSSEITVVMSYLAGVKLIVCFKKSLTRPNLVLIYYFYLYMAVRSVVINRYISDLLWNLIERYFEWANFVSPKNT